MYDVDSSRNLSIEQYDELTVIIKSLRDGEVDSEKVKNIITVQREWWEKNRTDAL
jgi:hypothetical protein